MRVKMSDVAKDAGVSIATVSCVLSGKRTVSEKSREKVLRSIRKLGYIPNVNARAFKSGRPTVAGIIVPEIDLHFYGAIIREVERFLSEKDIQLIVSSTYFSYERELKAVQTLTSTLVDGLIIASSSNFNEVSRIIPPGLPTVFFDYKPPGFKDFDRVTCLTGNATYEAVCDMISQGCKRIGAAFYDRNKEGTMRERREAYLSALKDHKFDYGEELIVFSNEHPAPPRIPSFYPCFERLIELGCDAILTPSQPITEQFINFRQQCDKARDIVYTGFYEYPWTERPFPNIGLVHQPVERIGREVAQLIINRLEEGYVSTPVKEVILQSVYVPAQ